MKINTKEFSLEMKEVSIYIIKTQVNSPNLLLTRTLLNLLRRNGFGTSTVTITESFGFAATGPDYTK